MYPVRKQMDKVVIFRPGALGDVLAVRGAIRLIRTVFPNAEICLLAPGGRGALFHRDGWADRWYDSERAVFSWLFSSDESQPQPALSAIFAGCDLFISFALDHALEHRVAALAPSTATVFCPSRPPPDHRQPIGEWLANAAASFCTAFDLVEPGTHFDLPAFAKSRLSFPERKNAEKYIVIHPGSGSPAKNWPLDNFIALGKNIQRHTRGRLPLIITSGEADGDCGGRLAAALSVEHLYQPELTELAETLANAGLYIGNDSGVSHLASAVETGEGGRRLSAVIFGPSDSLVWGPPDAVIMEAGKNMDGLPVESAWESIVPLVETALE